MRMASAMPTPASGGKTGKGQIAQGSIEGGVGSISGEKAVPELPTCPITHAPSSSPYSPTQRMAGEATSAAAVPWCCRTQLAVSLMTGDCWCVSGSTALA